MGKSSSNDELTIRNQFDRICKLALKGEAADYYRHIAYRQKHEVLFSELSQKELDSIFGVDKYTVENCFLIMKLPEISCSGPRGWCDTNEAVPGSRLQESII